MAENSPSIQFHSGDAAELSLNTTLGRNRSSSRRFHNMEVSWNRGTPTSSILVWFSLMNQPFGGTPIYGNLHTCSGIFWSCDSVFIDFPLISNWCPCICFNRHSLDSWVKSAKKQHSMHIDCSVPGQKTWIFFYVVGGEHAFFVWYKILYLYTVCMCSILIMCVYICIIYIMADALKVYHTPE